MLSIDIETYSEIDLRACGVYRYAEDESFQVLLFAYAVDDGPVDVVDLAMGEKIPKHIRAAMADRDVLKTAFNANFERVCLAQIDPSWADPIMWSCTSVRARYNGLPGSLDEASKALGLTEQKDAAGKRLIKYFSTPCKGTKANGGRTRNLPTDDPEKWSQFIEYCRQDVEVERAVRRSTKGIPGAEQALWVIDQHVNDAGVLVDLELADAAIEADRDNESVLRAECKRISGVSNPGSVAQIKKYLEENGVYVDGLRKETLPGIIAEAPNGEVRRVIEIRQQLSRTSTKKYETMKKAACKDGRVRGLFQFYGASRTGRWAGRLVQAQNLPRNYIHDIGVVRDLLKGGHTDMIECLYGSLTDTLSQLIRTAIVAPEGKKFIVSDFSAIEARVIAWMAGENWRLGVFKSHGKIYEASASAMFGVPLEQIHKGHPLRQRGKIAELALGYGGSKGALIAMGAADMGLAEEELPDLVAQWREANPAIVGYWYELERKAIEAIETGEVKAAPKLTLRPTRKGLAIRLPSGRELMYRSARVGTDERFNRPCITYLDDRGAASTYGGKLVENVVQAVARDCLAEAMKRIHAAGHKVVMHIHDEVVIEADQGDSLADINRLMAAPIKWAPGLPLEAAGFECSFYQKD